MDKNFIKNQTSHSFEKDQFVILKDKSISKTFNTINNFFNQHKFIRNSYEKVWVGENHVQGGIKKINYKLFKEINKYFVCELKDVFEKSTNLNDLELVVVRKNILKKKDSISMHKDRFGYCVAITVQGTSTQYNKSALKFTGGNVLFKKDNGIIVDIKLKPNELLLAKCTNEHGVQKVISGQRQSIALFTQPKSNFND